MIMFSHNTYGTSLLLLLTVHHTISSKVFDAFMARAFLSHAGNKLERLGDYKRAEGNEKLTKSTLEIISGTKAGSNEPGKSIKVHDEEENVNGIGESGISEALHKRAWDFGYGSRVEAGHAMGQAVNGFIYGSYGPDDLQVSNDRNGHLSPWIRPPIVITDVNKGTYLCGNIDQSDSRTVGRDFGWSVDHVHWLIGEGGALKYGQTVKE